MTRFAELDSRCCEVLAARAVAFEGCDVEAARQSLEPRRLRVEDSDLVILVERLHDGRADLTRADDEDPHERVAYFGPRRASTGRLP